MATIAIMDIQKFAAEMAREFLPSTLPVRYDPIRYTWKSWTKRLVVEIPMVSLEYQISSKCLNVRPPRFPLSVV